MIPVDEGPGKVNIRPFILIQIVIGLEGNRKDVITIRRTIVVVGLLLVFMALLIGSATAAPIKRDGTIYMNTSENLYMGSWDQSSSHTVKVSTNDTVDVYVLSSTQYSGYPESFTYTKAWENTKNVDSKFTSESSTGYYLVIDNQDNGRSGDAVPKGDITYSATYPNFLDVIGDEVEDLAWTGFWVCMFPIILTIVVIVVVIVVVIYLMMKKKKTPPQQQQPQYPQQQQYQQQPYQQQQYQQQPGYQQPPPPSPYEPPPPPPQ